MQVAQELLLARVQVLLDRVSLDSLLTETEAHLLLVTSGDLFPEAHQSGLEISIDVVTLVDKVRGSELRALLERLGAHH